jgi:hypothetical protein
MTAWTQRLKGCNGKYDYRYHAVIDGQEFDSPLMASESGLDAFQLACAVTHAKGDYTAGTTKRVMRLP